MVFNELSCLLYFSFDVNFDNKFLSKKINLGLDLQGGSYLLLEIDNTPVIEQKLQNLTTIIRNYFKDKNIRIKNIKLSDQQISFSVDEEYKETTLSEFNNQESNLNPYYPRFKKHQLTDFEYIALSLFISAALLIFIIVYYFSLRRENK